MELSNVDFQAPAVGQRLETVNFDNTGDFNPRGDPVTVNGSIHVQNGKTPVLSDDSEKGKDIFGAEPFIPSRTTVMAEDPFGMGNFSSFNIKPQELESAIGAIDKKLSEMKDGFSLGLSFGNEDFSLETLDPLNNKTS
ncbi:uncharacterized protein LOC106463808 [Limulus polyphemus]|uniref:Uncharacterized protein LOC106463808 n=1 Tax=Limulus polyphemus TaxID=6850 RepID=A0ABM1BCP6_LIMPO|nr:uncharacterized protein LOC106463808 [Limulus polyphemus]